MKLLITGGAGFIGSHFVKYILENYPDYKVINLDKLTYCGNLENLREVEHNPNYAFVKGDICDAKIVDQLVSRLPDAIINFAAETHVDRSIMGAQDFMKTDIFGTQTLLEAVKKYSIKKYVQISTDEVYGTIQSGAASEESNLHPNNPYSASKAGGDMMVRAYHRTYGLPVMITRGSNNFGSHQYPEKLIPLFITNLLEDKKVPVYGDGQQVRDWLYVLDHCAGIATVLHHGESGEIYNIGGDNKRTNMEITQIILDYLGRDQGCIEHVKDRPGHDTRYSIDSGKLQALGWEPKYGFLDAMARTIQWYIDTSKWWKPLKSGKYLEYYKKQYKK